MTTLWIAFGLYIVGVALVLYLRPGVMFRSGNGTWREFGLSNTGDYTVFPFWLFTLLWAVISYTLATLFTIFVARTALESVPATALNAVNDSLFTPVSQMKPPAAPAPAPVPARTSPGPGYYVLDASKMPPQYVYFGSNPPSVTNLAADSR